MPSTPAPIEPQSRLQVPVDAVSRVGVVDIGSNGVRLQIAEIGPEGVNSLLNHRVSIRLGRDVFLTGRILDETIDALADSLARFRDECDQQQVSDIQAIATAAMREAENRTEVLSRIRASSGVTFDTISGSEEAYLLNAAVRTRIDLREGRSLLVDLGGGSVEVSLVDSGEVVSSESYRLGALRVLRALESDATDPEAEPFLQLLDEYVAAVEGRIRESFGSVKIDRYVATGGNIDSIADVLRQQDKTAEREGVESVKIDDLKRLTRELAQRSYAERMGDYGLKRDRADTILPAAVVYYRIGLAARARRVLVPRVGLRDGLLQELVARRVRHTQEREHRDTLLNVCRTLGRRYHFDADHAELVRELAASIFDQTLDLHELSGHDRTLLEAAALLHDIGVFVSNSRHHKHSWYLIRSSDIAGLSFEDREIVALIARYHRRAHPQPKHFGYRELGRSDRRRVAKLGAILRLADSLDRGHQSKIRSVELDVSAKQAILRAGVREGIESDLMLERLGVTEKSKLFREVFGRKVELERPEAPR